MKALTALNDATKRLGLLLILLLQDAQDVYPPMYGGGSQGRSGCYRHHMARRQQERRRSRNREGKGRRMSQGIMSPGLERRREEHV